MISPTVQKIIEEKRGRLNAQFAEARLLHPGLDGGALLAFLGTTIAPVVEAVQAVAPERAPAVLEALYPPALALVSEDLVGPRTRDPLIGEGWHDLFPALARHLAAEPGRVAGALSNALFNLSRTPGARGREWIANLAELAPACPDVATLLRAGQVLAWRAGLAHFRSGALAVCARLDPALARAALGVPESSPVALDMALRQLADDPWLNPAALDGRPRDVALRIRTRVGAFRGFGGLFVAPPRVSAVDDQLRVTDGEGAWLLTADVFGATFHRTTADGGPQTADGGPSAVAQGRTADLGAWRVERGPKVTLGPLSQVLRELPDVSSAAAVGPTLAMTTTLSHAVYLIAVA